MIDQLNIAIQCNDFEDGVKQIANCVIRKVLKLSCFNLSGCLFYRDRWIGVGVGVFICVVAVLSLIITRKKSLSITQCIINLFLISVIFIAIITRYSLESAKQLHFAIHLNSKPFLFQWTSIRYRRFCNCGSSKWVQYKTTYNIL